MYRSKVILLLLILIFITGCVPARVIEKLAIINAYGVDITEGNPNQIDVTSITFQFNDQAGDITQTISGTGSTIREAFQSIASKTSFNPSPGQIRLILYGSETAQNGIFPYFNTLVRDSRVSEMMYSAISTSTAKELLIAGQESTGVDIALHLQGIIEKEIEEDSIPDVSFYNFNRTIVNTGEDSLLPLLGFKGNEPTLIGMAIFREDKYVGDISLDDAFLINLFQKRIRDKPFELPLPKEPFLRYLEKPRDEAENFHVDLLITEGRSNTKLLDIDKPSFKTDIILEVNLFETSEEMIVENKQVSDLLEREIEKVIESQYEELLSNLQEVNSDPFGLGKIYQAHKENGKLTSEEWYEKFSEATVDFNVNVKLINYGTIQ